MKSYLFGFLAALLISLATTIFWYLLFGYGQFETVRQYSEFIFLSQNFWIGVSVWTVLYSLFFIFPIIFIRRGKYRGGAETSV